MSVIILHIDHSLGKQIIWTDFIENAMCFNWNAELTGIDSSLQSLATFVNRRSFCVNITKQKYSILYQFLIIHQVRVYIVYNRFVYYYHFKSYSYQQKSNCLAYICWAFNIKLGRELWAFIRSIKLVYRHTTSFSPIEKVRVVIFVSVSKCERLWECLWINYHAFSFKLCEILVASELDLFIESCVFKLMCV